MRPLGTRIDRNIVEDTLVASQLRWVIAAVFWPDWQPDAVRR